MASTLQDLVEQCRKGLFAGREQAHALLDEDALCLGTDPGEWWDGRDAVLAALEDQLGQFGTMAFTADTTRVRQEGDVGWFAEEGSFSVGKAVLRVRWTGVGVRRDGEWRLAQVQTAPAQEAVEADY